MRRFVAMLVWWLALWELLARRRGWRGFSWGPGPAWLWRAPLALPLVRSLGSIRWLAALALPSLLLHAAVASIARRKLSPNRSLTPGSYPDRVVERVELIVPGGVVPGIAIAPRGTCYGAVAVLHGSGCDKTYFLWRLAEALLGEGLALLTIDLDGHGENGRPQTLAGATEGALAAVAWLRQRHAHVGLLGVSLGGCIAARAAADGAGDAQTRVDALALLEAPPLLWFTAEDQWREGLRLLQPFCLDLLRDTTAYELVRVVADTIAAQSAPRIVAEIGTVELIWRLNVCGALPQVTAPVLLLYGARDAIVPPWQARLVRAARPDAAFISVADASHLTLQLHPQAVAETAAWLRVTMTA